MDFKTLARSFLKEDIIQNKLYREQARSVWKELVSYLESGGYMSVDWPDQYNSRTFKLSIDLDWVSVELEDNLKIHLKTGSIGGGKYRHDVPAIVLNVFRMREFKEVYQKLSEKKLSNPVGIELKRVLSKKLPESFTDEVRKSFIHEYTHHIDVKYKEATAGPRGSSYDFDAYFKDPLETNARFQTALSEFERNKSEVNVDDFRLFADWFFDEYGELLKLERLSDEIKKSYLKRLYKYWNKKLES